MNPNLSCRAYGDWGSDPGPVQFDVHVGPIERQPSPKHLKGLAYSTDYWTTTANENPQRYTDFTKNKVNWLV